MQRSIKKQKALTSPGGSMVSAVNYADYIPLSQELNNKYEINFKKLSKKRQKYQELITFRQLFNFKRIQQIVYNSWNHNNILCQLCQIKYPSTQIFRLCNCQHQFCQNCLIDYVSFKINAMEQIRCPYQLCNQKVNINGQIFIKLPSQLKKKYHRAQLWRQTIANPDLKLCPIQQCDGQLDTKTLPLQCSVCRRYFCQQCMMQKHQGNCDKMYQMSHKQWRRCPNCRMFISKSQGCNHIRCRCGNQFCFVCLDKWDSTHYKCLQKQQMFYFNIDAIKHPYLVTIGMITAFPFFIMLMIIGLILMFIIMIPVGAIMGVGYGILKYYYLLCLLIPLLPLAAIIGVLTLPLMFLKEKGIPQCIHHFRRYRVTLQQLMSRLSDK